MYCEPGGHRVPAVREHLLSHRAPSCDLVAFVDKAECAPPGCFLSHRIRRRVLVPLNS